MQSFFNGLSGMLNFSKGLDNVSNNISNMNTPGYRGNDLFMRSMGGAAEGDGSVVGERVVRDEHGDLKKTGVATDLAINGDGYFVLKNDNGNVFYTRAGQFKFNDKNVLVDGATGFNVMSVNSAGALNTIDISANKTLPPVVTTGVDLLGNLNTTDTTYSVKNVVVYDATGNKHTLTLDFTKQALPAIDTWDVAVKNGATTLGNFTVQFDTNGSPMTGSGAFAVSLALGASPQVVNFNFGNNGSLSGATQLSGTSNLGATVKDGHGLLGITSLSVDNEGIIQLKYADSTTVAGPQVGLALFSDSSVLTDTENGLLKASSNRGLSYGKPADALFGSIQNNSLEMSNVDLTQEFADILIIQRGYQASSRVMSVSNDLLDQLYNSTRSK